MLQAKQALTKALYSKIKRMSFTEMAIFMTSYYARAYEHGQSDGLTEAEVFEVIKGIVGEDKTAEIMEALGAKLDEENQKEYSCGHCGADLTRYKEAEFCPKCGSELGKWWVIE